MKHRRHRGRAIRKVIMIHHNTGLRRIGFDLINTSRPPKQVGLQCMY